MKSDQIKIKEKAVLDKRYWLKIINVCNNRCIFCLDSDFNDINKILSLEFLKDKIKKAFSEGYKRLILSGGEASIHPHFIDLITFAKESGFLKIQTITNGRMFSYSSFTNKAINAGLSEITFSIHGHNPNLHDRLTGIPGSFNESLKGIKNVLKYKNCIVNIDIVINKLNIDYLDDIIYFFSQLGIYEYDLLHLVPFGRAYQNKSELFYDFNKLSQLLNQILKKYKNTGFYIWTNRIPSNLLEENEEFIQDPHKLYDEILGRQDTFITYYKYGKLWCYSQSRCSICFIKNFCVKFIEYNEYKNNLNQNYKLRINKANHINLINNIQSCQNINIEIQSDLINTIKKFSQKINSLIILYNNDEEFKNINYKKSTEQFKNFYIKIKKISPFFFKNEFDTKIKFIIELNNSNNKIILNNLNLINTSNNFSFYIPHYEILSHAKIEYTHLLDVLNNLKASILNCAYCINKNGYYENEINLNLEVFNNSYELDMKKLTNEFIINDYYVKSIRCSKCQLFNTCKGMHINFIRIFKFKILKEQK